MSQDELALVKRLEKALNEFIWSEYDKLAPDNIENKDTTPSISEPNEATYYILKRFCVEDPNHPFELCRPDPSTWKGKDWFESVYNAVAQEFSERDML